MRLLVPPVNNAPPTFRLVTLALAIDATGQRAPLRSSAAIVAPGSIAGMDEWRERVASARVGRLATVRPDGRPHLVPVCFALVGAEIVTVVDAKPKSTTALRRLDNVRAHPEAALLVDHYDDDWSTLWWVRVDGIARVEDDAAPYVDALAAKYGQYAATPPTGPAILVTDLRFTGWSFA
jgi:PPOX class probable F420-dependent enzyme